METEDVVIVGGGIIGLSAAFALRAAGVDKVIVVERGLVGHGSTAKATGGVRTQFSTEVNMKLALYARQYFEHWDEWYGGEVHFRPVGYLFVTATAPTADVLRAGARRQAQWGVDVDVITPDRIRDIAPNMRWDDLCLGTFTKGDGVADPGAAVNSLERACRRVGVEIVEHTSVAALLIEKDQIRGIRTDHQTLVANQVLVAAGAWTPSLLQTIGYALPIEPHHRQVYRTGPMAGWEKTQPMAVDLDSGLYTHSDGAGVVFGGGDRETVPGFDDTPRPAQVGEIIDRLIWRWPQMESAALTHTWAGLREMTPDDHGVLGPVPGIHGLFVAAGFSGHGFMQAPAVGAAVAALLTGTACPVDVTALDPIRFTRPLAREDYVF